MRTGITKHLNWHVFRHTFSTLLAANGEDVKTVQSLILFGLGYLVTGELAIPIGLHMAWNFFQGVVYGFPVSGDKEPACFLLTQQSGQAFFTGGSFGPEAGLMGILAAVLGMLMLWLYVKSEDHWPGQTKLGGSIRQRDIGSTRQ